MPESAGKITGRTRAEWFTVAQFATLAIAYLVPGVTGFYVFSEDVLASILAFEFGVIIFGFISLTFLFIPLLFVTNVPVRIGIVCFIGLIGSPLVISYQSEYGWTGLIGFLYLVFATYCGVLLRPMEHDQRILRLAEVALRWLVYMLLFLVLGEMVPTIYVERILNYQEGYWFGTSYFGLCALFEYSRRFPRTVLLVHAVFHGNYRGKPHPVTQLKNGNLKGFFVKQDTTQQWWLFLLAGIFCTGIVAVFFIVSFEIESIIGRIAFWVFLAPFGLIGVLLLSPSLSMMYRSLTTPAPSLKIVTQDPKYIAEGYVPIYSPGEERTGLRVELRTYTAEPLDQYGDNWSVKEQLLKVWDEDLIVRHGKTGSRFQIEQKLELPEETKLNLHLMVTEKTKAGNNESHWEAVIPLR